MTSMKERLGKEVLGHCTDALVRKYANIVGALNLHRLAEIMWNSWAFSIALDMATNMTVGYLDVLIRLRCNAILNYFHLLSIPMQDRHTGVEMLNDFTKELDALHPQWRSTVAGISTDGEKNSRLPRRAHEAQLEFYTALLTSY